MSKVDVALVFVVYSVATFGSFYVYVSHVGILANSFPKHVALVMTYVDAMYVRTCVFALNADDNNMVRNDDMSLFIFCFYSSISDRLRAKLLIKLLVVSIGAYVIYPRLRRRLRRNTVALF